MMKNAQQWLLGRHPTSLQTVGVIGAGTMGAGIAQTAAAAGHRVLLMDVRAGAAALAHKNIEKALDALVQKGRVAAEERTLLLNRIEPVDALDGMRDASLVIEVILEQLEPKQQLLRELEGIVERHAILASNTSSISITALAKGMQYPDRLVGMHFFNPVPVMKLVEIVSGAETASEVATLVFEKARQWGKIAVYAKSSPGFIVNRIARPFYAEALALLQEQAATPEQIDRSIRGAGFRMGPCELMDLIGHDINYSVTQSVFEANYGDRRYAPSLVQKALIDGGRLGRKSGKGFYESAPSFSAPAIEPGSALAPTSDDLIVLGSGPVAAAVAEWLTSADVTFARDANCACPGLQVGAIKLLVTAGRTADHLAALHGSSNIGVIDLPLHLHAPGCLAVAFCSQLVVKEREQVFAVLQKCRLQPIEVRDVPGLIVARTVAMLINEAADAIYQGVCEEGDADTAMKLGTNYPAGPFEWLTQLGIDYIVQVLDNLYNAYQTERYRTSPLLKQRFWNAQLIGAIVA